MINNVGKKTKEELIEEFAGKNTHNTLAGEQYSAAIIVKSASDIESSAEKIKQAVDQFKEVARDNSRSSDKLSKLLFWLNVVLTAATVVGAIATVLLALK